MRSASFLQAALTGPGSIIAASHRLTNGRASARTLARWTPVGSRQPGTIHVQANSIGLASATIAIAANPAKFGLLFRPLAHRFRDMRRGRSGAAPLQSSSEGYLRTYFFTSMVNSAPYMLPPASAVMPSGPVESAAAG